MFNFEENYKIGNERVELFPLNKKHFDSLFIQSDNEAIWTYFTEDGFGYDKFNKYINNAVQKRLDGIEYPFVIKDLKTEEIAGMTRLYAVDNKLGNIKIGHTWIGEKFQGTDLNKNAKYVLFEFLFEKLNFQRIGFGASAENIKSLKALKSIGCTQEGKLRGFLPDIKNKSRIDIILLSLLKNEWDLHVKKMLLMKIKSCH